MLWHKRKQDNREIDDTWTDSISVMKLNIFCIQLNKVTTNRKGVSNGTKVPPAGKGEKHGKPRFLGKDWNKFSIL